MILWNSTTSWNWSSNSIWNMNLSFKCIHIFWKLKSTYIGSASKKKFVKTNQNLKIIDLFLTYITLKKKSSTTFYIKILKKSNGSRLGLFYDKGIFFFSILKKSTLSCKEVKESNICSKTVTFSYHVSNTNVERPVKKKKTSNLNIGILDLQLFFLSLFSHPRKKRRKKCKTLKKVQKI